MNRPRLLLSPAAAVLLATQPFAAGTAGRNLSFQDVVAEAVRRNPALLAAGADIGIADGEALAAEGIGNLAIDFAASYQHDESALISGWPLQQLSYRDLKFQLGLTQPLPTGGSIGLRFATDRTRDVSVSSDPSSGESLQWTSAVSSPALQIVWSQPLLRGLGHVARSALRRARGVADASRLSRTAIAATTLRDVATAYAELTYEYEEIAVRRELSRAAHEHLAMVDAYIEAGKLPPSARAEVAVVLGLREHDLILAEQLVLERSLALRQLAGLPIGVGESEIVPDNSTAAPKRTRTLADAIERARAASPQLLAARAAGRTARIDVEVSENGLLPQLDFELIAGPTGRAESWTSAFAQLPRFSSSGLYASLTLHQSIPRRAALGAVSSARESLRKLQITEADILSQIDGAVVRFHSLQERAQRRLDLLRPAAEAAALDLAAERARFAGGRSTSFDVLRRQGEAASTRLLEARARADHFEASVALDTATGDLLDRFGVVLR